MNVRHRRWKRARLGDPSIYDVPAFAGLRRGRRFTIYGLIERSVSNRSISRFARSLFTCILVALSAGCRSLPALPPADLDAAGWRVQQGQAVWQPPGKRPELAGELLMATNSSGGLFVSFSKPPFSLVTARVEGGEWQIDFGSADYAARGRGAPPSRFAWFQLPVALAGAPASGPWRFSRYGANNWRLENEHTGESLEGELQP